MKHLLTALLLASLVMASASARESTPEAEATEIAPDLFFTDYVVEEGQYGGATIIGALENRSDDAYQTPFLLVTFLDDQGDILGETTMLSFVPVIPAQSVAPVFGSSSKDTLDAFLEFDSVEVSPSFGEPSVVESPNDLSVSDIETDTDGNVKFRVTNDGPSAADGVGVAVTIFDTRGDLINAGFSSLRSGLDADQSGRVTVSLYLDTAVPADADIEVIAVGTE